MKSKKIKQFKKLIKKKNDNCNRQADYYLDLKQRDNCLYFAADRVLYHLTTIIPQPENGQRQKAVKLPKTTVYTNKYFYLKADNIVFLLIINGAVALIFLGIILWLNLKLTATPVNSLMQWTKSLNKNNVAAPIPNFFYAELNQFARLIHKQAFTMNLANTKEKRFLSYISHELNNIVNVISANGEIINYYLETAGTNKKERKNILLHTLKQLEQSSQMTREIVQGILWLEKDLDDPAAGKLELGKLLSDLIRLEESNTFSGDKTAFTVKTDIDTFFITVWQQPLKIVLTNLIRNSFHHSAAGVITVSLKQGVLTVKNPFDPAAAGSHERNFGIGLELTARLLAKLNIKYKVESKNNVFRISVDFSPLHADSGKKI